MKISKKVWRWIRWSCLALLAAYGIGCVETSQTVAYVCENTGSFYGYRLWPGGLKTGSFRHASPLETYVAAATGKPVEHRWSRCANMGTTLLGDYISFSDGAVGGMVYLRFPDLDLWIRHHKRAETLALYEFFLKADFETSKDRAMALKDEISHYQ